MDVHGWLAVYEHMRWVRLCKHPEANIVKKMQRRKIWIKKYFDQLSSLQAPKKIVEIHNKQQREREREREREK